MITGSSRRASPCPGRVATCATCGATTLPRPHQLVAAIYGYERASSATLVATIYAANSVADLLLHAARCEGAKLPRCKVHEAVAMPHIWPKQNSAQIAAAVTSCHGTCNTQRPVCATHICNSPRIRIRFHWPLSPLPLNCFFRSRIRDVFVTVLRCISVATFLLPAPLWFHLATWSVHSAGVVFVSITFSVHLHPAPPSQWAKEAVSSLRFHFWDEVRHRLRL